MGQLLKLIVGQVEFLEQLKLREKLHDHVQVLNLLVLQVQERRVRLVLQVVVDHVFQVLLTD